MCVVGSAFHHCYNLKDDLRFTELRSQVGSSVTADVKAICLILTKAVMIVFQRQNYVLRVTIKM